MLKRGKGSGIIFMGIVSSFIFARFINKILKHLYYFDEYELLG